MADEFDPDGGFAFAAGVEEGEAAGVEVVLDDGLGDGAGDEFAGAGVGGVSFDDDGASGGERGGGVTAGGAVGEWEVAGAEDGDGPEGAEHSSDVGLGEWASGGVAAVDGGADPGAVADHRGEEAEGVDGAFAFGDEASGAEAGFGGGDFHEVVAEVGDACCAGVEEGGALVLGAGGEVEECLPCGAAGGVYFVGGCGVVGGFKVAAGGWVEGAEGARDGESCRGLGVLAAGEDAHALDLDLKLGSRGHGGVYWEVDRGTLR